jgi:hypothetical protein
MALISLDCGFVQPESAGATRRFLLRAADWGATARLRFPFARSRPVRGHEGDNGRYAGRKMPLHERSPPINELL